MHWISVMLHPVASIPDSPACCYRPNHQRGLALRSRRYLQHRQADPTDSEQKLMEWPMQQVLRRSGFAWKRPIELTRMKDWHKKSERIEVKPTFTERTESEPKEQFNMLLNMPGSDVRATIWRNVVSSYRAIIPRMPDCLGQSVHGSMQTCGYHPHVPGPPFMGPSSSLVTHPP
jgi:hypothetical protein